MATPAANKHFLMQLLGADKCLGIVGIWNGWEYRIAFLGALNLQISEPEIWQKSLSLRNLRDFPANFGF